MMLQKLIKLWLKPIIILQGLLAKNSIIQIFRITVTDGKDYFDELLIETQNIETSE